MADKKNINYLNRDFNTFKNALIDFTKTYYPTTYTDFTPVNGINYTYRVRAFADYAA